MLGPLASIWDPLGYLLELRRRFGGLARFQVGRQWTFLATDPDLIHELLVTRAGSLGKARGLRMARRMLGDGLLTSEGEYHRQQRRLMLPGFAPQQVAFFGESVVALAQQVSYRWRPGSTVDCLREFSQLTLTIAGRTLFDSDFESQAALVAGMLNQGRWLFRWGSFLFPLLEWLERLPPVRHLLLQRRRRIDDLVYPVIEEHRRTPRANFLSNLIQAGMSDEAIRDEAVTLLLAAHETTANALAWTCHLLALHPDWQRRLGEELEQVLDGRPATVEATSRLPLLKNVLLESMRLFPPNWMIARVAREDFRLGDQLVPEGSTCLVSQYVLHREARWFPDPERFDPDRWQHRPRTSLPRTAYLPFGIGARRCIGEHFALLESELILATLLQRWWLVSVAGQRVRPDPAISLRPRPGPRLRLLLRQGRGS
ncbi:MAG: cytochrome P450 [Candidatus Eremiobacteraeota bacterium]|nr:cytochrome P450 [Candidatus Eremiobacteraeota bacterium]